MIKSIRYNWRQVGTTQDREGCGDDYELYVVGRNNVLKIVEQLPAGPTYPHCCVVSFLDGHQERIMNINAIISDEQGF